MSVATLPPPPACGDIVRVRQRQYLVEDVQPSPVPSERATLVSLSCLDDDAQGQELKVLWELEIDTEVLRASWDRVGQAEFDSPSRFAAYLHALRWNCVTATDAKLFQAPWRAGIEVKAYQLEPLRKALLLPRVNLFIADDVGVGKTIEAALVLRELLMRQRVRRVLVVAPPSVVTQWREELEQRFGLTFVIYDREFVAKCRQERGYGVNPWQTHSRFILSHALLRNEEYIAPLRDLLSLDEQSRRREGAEPGSMLILDEAHHAAPATSSKYAIDSQFTRAVRDLADRFEHRLFLSATPHNGLSNSFSALLEILDPQRFVRGDVVEPKLRDQVMVRRLKADLRKSDDFPLRKVVKISLSGLPADAPELVLARLLDEYWELRDERLKHLSNKQRAAQGLVLVNLQKRLFSSVEAFYRTLSVHKRALQKAKQELGRNTANESSISASDTELLFAPPDPEDDRSALGEEVLEQEEELAVERVTMHGGGVPTAEELALVDKMEAIAARARILPDARVRWLIDWIRREQCTELPEYNAPAIGSKNLPADRPRWNTKRVVIFTEYADTKRYIESQLMAVVRLTDKGDLRLRPFHGGMGDEARDAVKHAFNADPAEHPLRILVATDAAREGVNLQNYCSDLFHMDLPWNPSKLEQRNGRIDRKLQREPEVRCHYFVYAQREADRVLEVLAERSSVIREELGSMPPVLEERIERKLSGGIRRKQQDKLTLSLLGEFEHKSSPEAQLELEGSRENADELEKKLKVLREQLSESEKHLKLNAKQLRTVLDEALSMMNAEPLKPTSAKLQVKGIDAYEVASMDRKAGADPTWADTLDTLRTFRPKGMPLWEWRKTAPVRPVVFTAPKHIEEAVVHLHLEHRVVQRLLGRFLAQGFALDDLSRACVMPYEKTAMRVILLGRMSLYADGAARLHDEIVSVTAEWSEASGRKKPLKALGEKQQDESWSELLETLSSLEEVRKKADVPLAQKRAVQSSVARDVAELLPQLQARCARKNELARGALDKRGAIEAEQMVEILSAQEARIKHRLQALEAAKRGDVDSSLQLSLSGFSDDELRQQEDDAKYWRKRLEAIPREKEREPLRIKNSYSVRATRIEPVGIIYLWPVTG